MAEENTDVIGSAPTDASPDATGSSPESTTSPQAGASSADVSTQSSDQTAQPQADQEQDIFAGIPSVEELEQMAARKVDLAAGLLQMRKTLEPLSAEHKELSSKYQVFEPVADRFGSAEELQKLVTLTDSLNKYSSDPVTGALRPDLSEFAAQVTTDDPVRADHLTSTLIWGQTTHPGTGQPVTRAELVLQVMANDPELRAHALRTLGGVDPFAVPAPTWTPTQEELEVVKPELQDIYKKLPFDKRESLRLNDPDFINEYLDDQKFKAETRARNEQAEIRQREYVAQQEQRVEQEAVSAGHSYAEQGFKSGFTSFANHIYETWKPTDNAEVNKREGALVALAVAALSTPDTRFAAEQAFKEMGIDQKTLDEFNAAREGYAKSGREFGYLTHKKQRTNGDPDRARQKMIAKAKDLATILIAGRNEYFNTRATAHNDNLDQTERARPLIGGSPMTSGISGSGNRYLNAGKRTEAEIYGS